ncbi:glycine zipper 2TM domain-containing protein [Halomonas smyrnensis]|uniref:glycine zipper 2TM domain-containing protein n=1 Tax=Halomonas smyrnensis TaxID=720605 RepID=UPI00030321FF|nr:glycine zipper 2TM domain-containing protein [Halomonas smyrnensis]
MKRFLPLVALGALTLAGCANTSPYSGNVYSGNQAQVAQNVSVGTITAMRRVQIQADDQNSGALGGIGGAVIGGLLGNQIGGGSGRTLATAAGAIGGSVAGKKIEDSANRTDAWELEIRKQTGQTVVVVQKADQPFQVGQQVRLIGTGSRVSVAPY